MNRKSDFTPEERARAAAIMDGVSGKSSQKFKDELTYYNPSSGINPVVGLLGVGLMAAIVWVGYVMLYQDKPVPSPVVAPYVPLAVTAKPSPAPAPVVQQNVVRNNVTRVNPVQVQPRASAPVVTRAAPVQRSAPQVYQPAIQANTRSQHAAVAKKAVDNKFRYEVKLGSGNVTIMSIDFMEEDTKPVTGWPRYRTEGKVGIAYYDSRGEFKRTTRGFEALTEEKNGSIKAVDVIAK
ncbi:MAG: hypothetical protein K9N01_12870 [Cephaloticoccus sp.]|nr:hypothetical protein [Cephaloticoccus sp.]